MARCVLVEDRRGGGGGGVRVCEKEGIRSFLKLDDDDDDDALVKESVDYVLRVCACTIRMTFIEKKCSWEQNPCRGVLS